MLPLRCHTLPTLPHGAVLPTHHGGANCTLVYNHVASTAPYRFMPTLRDTELRLTAI